MSKKKKDVEVVEAATDSVGETVVTPPVKQIEPEPVRAVAPAPAPAQPDVFELAAQLDDDGLRKLADIVFARLNLTVAPPKKQFVQPQ